MMQHFPIARAGQLVVCDIGICLNAFRMSKKLIGPPPEGSLVVEPSREYVFCVFMIWFGSGSLRELWTRSCHCFVWNVGPNPMGPLQELKTLKSINNVNGQRS